MTLKIGDSDYISSYYYEKFALHSYPTDSQ